jgi:hypothetical protein
MGLEIISCCGMKCFLNKFKRKGAATANAARPSSAHRDFQGCPETEPGCEQGLILLLAQMVQSAGANHGFS